MTYKAPQDLASCCLLASCPIGLPLIRFPSATPAALLFLRLTSQAPILVTFVSCSVQTALSTDGQRAHSFTSCGSFLKCVFLSKALLSYSIKNCSCPFPELLISLPLLFSQHLSLKHTHPLDGWMDFNFDLLCLSITIKYHVGNLQHL